MLASVGQEFVSVQLVAAPDPASNATDSTFAALLAYLACSCHYYWYHPSRRTLKYSGGRFCFSYYRPSRLIIVINALVNHNLRLYPDCLVMMQVVVAISPIPIIIAWLLERGLGKSDQTAGYGRTSS